MNHRFRQIDNEDPINGEVRMIIKRLIVLMATALSLAISSASALEGDAEAGKQAAVTCVACHHANGGGMNIAGGESWPALAGLDANYLYKQLQDIKSGQRNSPSMTAFANMLSDQQKKEFACNRVRLPRFRGNAVRMEPKDNLAMR